MKVNIKSTAFNLSIGFVVLVFFSIVLFIPHWIINLKMSNYATEDGIWYGGNRVEISPAKILPKDIENDPCAVYRSTVKLRRNGNPYSRNIGIGRTNQKYIINKMKLENMCDVFKVYFDEETGNFVLDFNNRNKENGGRKATFYIGPKGISTKERNTLGKFREPLLSDYLSHKNCFIIYDSRLRKFYRIDTAKLLSFAEAEDTALSDVIPVVKSDLDKNFPGRLLLVRNELEQNKHGSVGIDFRGPAYMKKPSQHIIQVNNNLWTDYPGPYVLLLDDNAQIHLFDVEKMEIAGPAGYLPKPPSLFGYPKNFSLNDVLDYDILPLSLRKENGEFEYLGLFTASVSRDGTAEKLAVFDSEGKKAAQDMTKFRIDDKSNSEHVSMVHIFSTPGGPLVMTLKYFVENLHPPALHLLNILVSEKIHAGDAVTAIFVWPNSYAGIISRSAEPGFSGKTGQILMFLFPGLILCFHLSQQVRKDARRRGLNSSQTLLWSTAVFWFGIPGWLAYKFNRPAQTLVTCPDCGELRRPDLRLCHNCEKQWQDSDDSSCRWQVADGLC